MNSVFSQCLILLSSIYFNVVSAQQVGIPFLNALGNGQLGQLASLATGIANMATEGQFGSIPSAPAKSLPTSSAVGAQPGFGTGPLSGSASAANTIESTVEVGDKVAAAGVESKNGGMDLLSLAKTFSSFLNPNAASSRQSASSPEVARASSPLTRLAPGASDNFGIPQGEDCFPLFSGIIRIMNKDCQKKTETRTWQTWGTQINNALIGGQIDLVKAARETCRLGAERQMCTVLGEQIARCDIIGSLQNAVELQRQTQRCEQVTAFADLPRQQNTGGLIGSLNNLINGEVSGGLLQNFFG